MKKSTTTYTFPTSNSTAQNAKLWADRQQQLIEPGHGLFFEFKDLPELEKLAINYLIKHYHWVLEKPFFIRKPSEFALSDNHSFDFSSS